MTSSNEYPLDWVDGFILEARPYLFLREFDSLLIILPNQSYRLNPTGVSLLKPLLTGQKLETILAGRTPPPPVQKQLFDFFTGIVSLVKGCMGEGSGRPEVEMIQYEPPFHRLPILSEIAITNACNLRCRFCYAGSPSHGSSPGLTLDQVKHLLKKIRHEAQVPSVSFTGGEPTTHPELPEMIRAAKAEGMRVNLITNAVLVDAALANRLKEAGLDSAQVSLEGPNAEIHESLTVVPGSFEATLAGLAALKKADIPVHTNTTLSGGNVKAATRMPAFVKTLALDRLSMNMIIPSTKLKAENHDLLLTYSTIGETVLAVRAAAREAGVRFMWYSPTPYCLFNPISHNLGNKGCAACDGLLSIDPTGRVIPCSSFFEPQGSLLDQSFEEIWSSLRAVHIRQKELAPVTCRTCDSMKLCEGACPLYWDAMGCQELDQRKIPNIQHSTRNSQ